MDCSSSATDATRSGAKDDVSMSKRSKGYDDGFVVTPTACETLIKHMGVETSALSDSALYTLDV